MSINPSPSPPNDASSSSSSEHLYFAFGSNLHLAQMRRRCPESRYIGTAKLHDYRWQINSRGYANVLPSTTATTAGAGHCVEGLVYLLSARDEARLDEYEGVAVGCYAKQFLNVEVFTASIGLVGRLVGDLVPLLEGDDDDTFSSASNYYHLQQQPSARGEMAEALVYVSLLFQEEGRIRDEYIARMNAGIVDACKLGVSDSYVENCLRRYIPE